MAEHDQNNDEYLFGDLDEINPEATESSLDEDASKTYELPSTESKNNIRRNALIVVSVVVLSLIIYSFFGSKTPYTEKKVTTKSGTIQPTAVQPITQVPVQSVVETSTSTDDTNSAFSALNDKLTTVESAQDTLRSEVNTMNTQVVGVNNSVSSLMEKMAELNQVITQLSSKVDEQTLIIERLMARPKIKTVHTTRKQSPGVQNPKYYVQAVIPGRAWLIATNGTTLTVREGSVIRGYGLVKLIDPTLGRVMTSSGQVIRFNQDDS